MPTKAKVKPLARGKAHQAILETRATKVGQYK